MTRKRITVFLDHAAVSGFSFLTVLLLARVMSIREFGFTVIGMAALNLFQSLQHAGITRAHNVQLSGHPEGSTRRATFNATTILLSGTFGLAAGLLILTVSWTLGHIHEALWHPVVPLVALTVAPWVMQDAVRRVFHSQDRPAWSLLLNVVSYGGQVALMAALASSGAGLSLSDAWFCMAAAALTSAIVGLIHLWKSEQIRHIGQHARIHAVHILRYGKWLSLAEVTNWMGKNGWIWVFAAIVGVEAAGQYKAAVLLAAFVNPFLLTYYSYAPSRIVEASASSRSRLESSLFRFFATPALLLGGIIFFLAPWLTGLLFPATVVTTESVLILRLAIVTALIDLVRIRFKVRCLVGHTLKTIVRESVASTAFLMLVGIPMTWAASILGGQVALLLLGLILALYYRNQAPSLVQEAPEGTVRTGGEATVYHDLGQALAIKQYHAHVPEAAIGAEIERHGIAERIWKGSGCRAPRLVAYDPVGRALTMEWISAPTLESLLRSGTLSDVDLRQISWRLGEASRAFHQSTGLPLPDLSVRNVHVDPENLQTWILDFGDSAVRTRSTSVGSDLAHLVMDALATVLRPSHRGLVFRYPRLIRFAADMLSQVPDAGDQGTQASWNAQARRFASAYFGNAPGLAGRCKGFVASTWLRLAMKHALHRMRRDSARQIDQRDHHRRPTWDRRTFRVQRKRERNPIGGVASHEE